MKNRFALTLFRAALAAMGACLLLGYTAQQADGADPRKPVCYSPGWASLGARTGTAGDAKVLTISALPTGFGKKRGEVATREQANDALGFDPAAVRRTFNLEKTVFLLGEPLLVKFSIELDGNGKWGRDDWLYHNNRDETFIILIRGKEGRWLPDRYHRENFYCLGGAIAEEAFDRKNPEVHWLPVQQYCAITDVGEYDLYCMKWDTRCEGNYPVSPLRAEVPKDVAAEIDNRPIVKADCLTDYARFRISVTRGDDKARAEMVRHWTSTVLPSLISSPHRGKPKAAFQNNCSNLIVCV